MAWLLWRVAYHLLLNRAEDRATLRVVHLDANAVAIVEERCLRSAMQDGLDRADFGNARVADAALGDRLARAAVGVAVRHRAGADDYARAERAGLGGMRHQGWKIERHVDTGIGLAERRAVEE